MNSHAAAVLRGLDAIEVAVQRAGMPPMSPWWRSTLEEVYEAGRRRVVLRVGRRGGKSSTLCRVG